MKRICACGQNLFAIELNEVACFAESRQPDFGGYSSRNIYRERKFASRYLTGVDTDSAANGGNFSFNPVQRGDLRFDADFFKACFQRFNADQLAGDDIGWSRSPGMVPIQIVFIFIIPGF
ncbi:hypothetical protein SDC9_178620 [bioreactor metagenome]|uniref:Uncharacterized protein n=1 Tax=bioreactor metagenome TaxID=1076179 RepID=A0A645GY20_9ZZZZ